MDSCTIFLAYYRPADFETHVLGQHNVVSSIIGQERPIIRPTCTSVLSLTKRDFEWVNNIFPYVLEWFVLQFSVASALPAQSSSTFP